MNLSDFDHNFGIFLKLKPKLKPKFGPKLNVLASSFSYEAEKVAKRWTYIGRLNKCSFSFASHTFAGSTFAVEYISSWYLLQLPHLQFYSCAIGTLAAQHFCSCTSAAHTLAVYLFAVDTYPASHICCWHICSWTAYVAANICSSTIAVKVVLLQFHICSRGTILAVTYLT